MKGDTKCGKWFGWFGIIMSHSKSLEMAPFDSQHTSSVPTSFPQ